MPLVAGLGIGLPIVGANMDTVVGEEMARALALEGAFGFLHRSSPHRRPGGAREVRQDAPLLRHREAARPPRRATIAEVRRLIERHRSSGILIEETGGRAPRGPPLAARPPARDRDGERLVEELMTPRRAPRDAPALRQHGGGRADDVGAAGREAPARRRGGAHPRPRDDARPPPLQEKARTRSRTSAAASASARPSARPATTSSAPRRSPRRRSTSS